MSMGAVAATLLTALLALHWALAPGFADDGCSGFRHLENGRTFFRYGGLYVTFSCNPGFRIHGYRTSSCVSGQWAREPPLCVAPGCPSPGELLHGSREVSPDSSVVRFTCNSGFRLFGSTLLYCKGKRWNGTMPVCKESDIMSSFYLKQTSIYKPSVELNPNSLSSLKNRFNTIAHTASKEAFLKPSFLEVPQPKPFLGGDVFKAPQKPSEKKLEKKLWSDRATTQAKGGTGGLNEMITRLINQVDPVAQPPLEATLLDTTVSTVPTKGLTSASLLSRPTESANLPKFTSTEDLDHMLSPSPIKYENEKKLHVTSATQIDYKNPVTSFPGEDDFTMVAEDPSSQSTQSKVKTSSPDKHSLVGITTTSFPEVKDSKISSVYSTNNPLQPSVQEDSTTSLVTFTDPMDRSSVIPPTSLPDLPESTNHPLSLITSISELPQSTNNPLTVITSFPDLPESTNQPLSLITSFSDLPQSTNQPLSLITSSKPFLVTSSPFIPAVVHDGELPLHESLTTRSDEDLLPRTEVSTASTQKTAAQHLTESPDVPTKDPYLQQIQHSPESGTHLELTSRDEDSAESIDVYKMVLSHKDGELNDVSRSVSIQTLLSPLTLKNKTPLTNIHGQEINHATSNHSVVVSETPDSADMHNPTSVTPEIPGPLTRKRRPVCPYPPLPAHGTFYFRTIANPAPFQYKHYVQYACYPGYTLANGDVYSYCLQDRQWSGVTPMCIEETPCSSNNGGCSQVCQVNDQNRAECHCKPGFQLLEDQLTCRDLDECVEGLHQCQQVCENTFGSYRCSCSAGFQLSADRMSCTDVDECVQFTGRARCVFGCINTPGSFHCHCPAGYSMNITDDRHCTDLDECLENGGRGPCESSCVNSPGSFHCVCPHGYQVAGDGRTCVSECPAGYRKQSSSTEPCTDINECEEMAQQQIQQQRCEWKCVNLPGSYRCVCPRGYLQHADGHQCKDLNECELKNGGCSHTCLNLRGSFKCTCPENYRISPYNRRKCQPVHSSQRTVS